MDIAWDIKKYKQKGTFLTDGSFVWRQYKRARHEVGDMKDHIILTWEIKLAFVQLHTPCQML
jgi:hypothetical protein